MFTIEKPVPGSAQFLLSTAIDQATEGVLITDASARIVYVNPAFTRLTGYSAEEVIGRNPRRLKSRSQEPRFYRELWQTVSAGRVWQGDLINRRKDGTRYVENMTISPGRDASGAVANYIAFKQDVSVQW